MDPEPGRRGDVGDVAQEIGADDGVVAAARRAEHGRPRGIDDGLPVIRQMRLAVGEQPREGLAAVIADAAEMVDDLRVGLRELCAEKHAVDVDRLTEVRHVLVGAHQPARVVRNGPRRIRAGSDGQRLEIDAVDRRGIPLTVRHGDLEELAHVVVAVGHDDVLAYRVVDPAEPVWQEREDDFLAVAAAIRMRRHGGLSAAARPEERAHVTRRAYDVANRRRTSQYQVVG